MFEANKKQVPLKSYSPKIRIDSVNQILRNKENLCLSNNKNRGPGPYNSFHHDTHW